MCGRVEVAVAAVAENVGWQILGAAEWQDIYIIKQWTFRFKTNCV